MSSQLNKKHNQLAYNAVRWAVAAEVIRVAWIDGKENLAYVLTKVLSLIVRQYLFGNWTY